MLTIKLKDSHSERILEAESFTVIHGYDGSDNQKFRAWIEITLHHSSGDTRYDVGDSPMRDVADSPVRVYDVAYIENATGRTVATYGSKV
jgi:hypothetical protein